MIENCFVEVTVFKLVSVANRKASIGILALHSKYSSYPLICFAARSELFAVAGFTNSFAVGNKIVLFGGVTFLSSKRLEVSGPLQIETVIHVMKRRCDHRSLYLSFKQLQILNRKNVLGL